MAAAEDEVIAIVPMLYYTQPVRTQFLFKSIWIRSQGFQGCQKISFLLQIYIFLKIFFDLGAILVHQTSNGLFSGPWRIF